MKTTAKVGTWICEEHYLKLGRECREISYAKMFENLCDFCNCRATRWLCDVIDKSEVL